MIKIENRCCDCATPAYPCLGRNCPRRYYEAIYCDDCGEEIESGNEIEVDGKHYCPDCFEKLFGEDGEENDA